MSQITDLLAKTATMEKQAYASYIKGLTVASIKTLVESGLPFEKAASYAKDLCLADATAKAKLNSFDLIEKVAGYVSLLEANIEELEKQAESRAEPAQVQSEEMSKLASYGFSDEELEMLSHKPGLVEKVASTVGSPGSMGSGVGAGYGGQTDPLMDFLLS